MIARLCVWRAVHNACVDEDVFDLQHGKMDLTEVEGTADLLAANTAAQQRQARNRHGGAGCAAPCVQPKLWSVKHVCRHAPCVHLGTSVNMPPT